MKDSTRERAATAIEPGVSCVVCTYNGSSRIARVLNALARQKQVEGISWEVIVVDNASIDDLQAVAKNENHRFSEANLRVVYEPNPGLIHARLRGLREARYSYVSFIDDDNLVEETWVYKVKEILDKHPDVAVCGGQSVPIFEIEPPKWFSNFSGCFAVGKQYEKTGDITQVGSKLWGAGMSVRKRAMDALVERGYQFKATGRTGKSLISGEDTELCYELRISGWRLWYQDDLKLWHMIADSRLRWDYLVRLYKGFGSSKILFASYLERFRLADEPIRYQWFPELLRNVNLILRRPIPIYYLITRREGKFSALKCAAILGRIQMLLRLRSRYDKSLARGLVANQCDLTEDLVARQSGDRES